MSDLPGLLAIADDYTASVVELSPNTLAVLLYALGKVYEDSIWADYRGEHIPAPDIETIHDLVEQASFEVMNPIMPTTIPVGATMTWHMVAPPSRWLLCNGAYASKLDYPLLYALWGNTFGGEQPDHFALLNMTEKSPFGHGGTIILNAAGGEWYHALTEAEMPAHTHPPLTPSTAFITGKAAGSNGLTTTSTNRGSEATTGSRGGGVAHSLLHPVRGVNWIVYAGEIVP